MSIDALAAIILAVFLAVFLWRKRKKVELQKALFPLLYVVLYRSRFGVDWMQRMAKRFPRLLRVLGDVGTVVGFIGMAFIVVQMFYGTITMFLRPDAVASVQPVLPIEAKGVFFVPFLYWILSIFFIAVVHEFAHGVLSFVHKVPVKRSGFAFVCLFIPVIPAAFVEPDEKVLRAAKKRSQLAVFAAGPFSNVLFALLALVLFFAASPILSAAYEERGLRLDSVEAAGPAYSAGLREDMIVTGIDEIIVVNNGNMSSYLQAKSPGDEVAVATAQGSFPVTLGANPKNESRAFLGVQVRQELGVKESFAQKYGAVTAKGTKWFAGLFFWLFMLNLGIGLFNLLPIGPLDGGRMFELAAVKIFGKNVGMKVWTGMTYVLIAMILFNLVAGFVR